MAGSDAGVIRSADLSQDANRAELRLEADGDLSWTALQEPGASLTIGVLRSRPGPEVTNLATQSGLVASVLFEEGMAKGTPATMVRITTREAAVYSVAPGDGELTLNLWVPGAGPPPGTGAESAPAGATSGAAAAPPAQTVQRPAVPSPGPSGSSTDYEIAAGDVIGVDVFGVDEFDRRTRVQGDGRIAMPLLGRIPVAGLTVEQAEKEIARQLRQAQLVTDPRVIVTVEEYASYGVTVQGAVQNPGIYPVIGERSLLELIWEAGGLSDDRSLDQKILVFRDEGGETRRIEVDAYQLVDEGDMTLNIPVRPGDQVVVPKARRGRVYVSGAVRQPGPVEFDSSSKLTVLQAITLAGGPTERAALGKVVILRQNPDGSQSAIDVDVKKIQKGKADDVFLQNNDTVRVSVWFF